MTSTPEQLTASMISDDLLDTIYYWLNHCEFPHPWFPDDPGKTIQYKAEVLSIPEQPGEPMTLRYTSQDELLPGEWIVRVNLAVEITPAAGD